MIKLVLLALLVLGVVAIKFLPWYVSVGLLLGGIALLRFVGPKLLKRLFMAPFKAKGKVLKDAEAEVHGIEPSAAPAVAEDFENLDPDEIQEMKAEMEAEREGRQYFKLDVTIRPRPNDGPMSFWEPGELLLAPPGSSIEDDEGSQVEEVEVFRNGQFQPDDECKYHGEQRLRLTVGLPEGHNAPLAFQYYFEQFGEVRIPR